MYHNLPFQLGFIVREGICTGLEGMIAAAILEGISRYAGRTGGCE
jgi:hypothetical protein